MKTLRLFSFVSLLVLLGAHAPVAVAQSEPERVPRPVSVRIVQLTGKSEGLYLRGKEDVRCQLSQRRISAPVDITVLDDVIRFYRKTDAPAADAPAGAEGDGYQLAAEVKLPPAGRHFLLLFKQDAAAPGGYRVAALPRDDLAGRAGQVIFYNLSSHPVAGQSGESRFQIERGSQTSIRPGAGKNNNLSLRLARYADDNWEAAFSTVWGRNPDLNTLFFIFDADGGKNAIDVRRFYDTPFATPKPSGSSRL